MEFAEFISSHLDELREQFLEHLWLTLVSVTLAVITGMFLGILIAKKERLAALVAQGYAPGREAEAVAHALGRIGDPGAEPCLLRLLAFGQSHVRLAAARALGRVGSVAAVEPLLRLTRGLTVPGNLKRAAGEGVTRIQARLGDVEAGRLSLARCEDPEGALSLAGDPDERGALSLETASDEEGQAR